MKVEDCFELGYIARVHGIAGELRAVFDVTDLRKYKKKETFWLLKAGRMSLFTVESFHLLNDSEALIAFKELPGRDEAELWKGSTILLPLEELPPAPKGKFYFHEVEGFQVEDKKLGRLGTVKGVLEMPAQNLVQMDYQGHEVLIPVTNKIVTGIDREQKLMFTVLPEGHLDVYLGAGDKESENDA